jgi:hypothetical protein
MRLGNHIRILTGFLLLWPAFSFASFENELQIQTFKYATDDHATLSISNQSYFESESFLTRVNFYVESGPLGSWSFDPDPLRYNLKLNSKGTDFLWFGREHPLNLVRGEPVEFTSALGSVWTQNQLEPLSPRVSGWIGTGFVKDLNVDSSWKLVGAYSPLFLPSFGPSLGFTDRGELNPSRFARLPPSQVNTGGVTVPIRYQLRIDQLSELVLQNQAFLGVSHNTDAVNFDIYAYTAPKPDPVARTDAKLAVGEDAVNARVDVKPQFPREYWVGTRVQNKTMPFKPAFEFLQKANELSVHVASITGYLDGAIKGSFGVTSHFQKMFDGPTQSDGFVFVNLPFALSDELTLHSVFQATLLNGKRGWYWMNQLEYAFKAGFSVLGAIRILSGEDNSYFGDWRNQDSVSMGFKWAW